VVFQAIPDVLT